MGSQPLLAELGRRLKAARVRSGLSLADLARRSGLSRRYVTEAEAGRANLSVLRLAELAQVLRTPLVELLGPAQVSSRSERVALVGLRGAGKSTVGRALALRLEVPFVELDARVEELAGLSLAEIFAIHGEQHFHKLEGEALESALASAERMVIATGGSIVASSASFERLRATCRTVWLSASPEEHFQRVLDQGDRRPMHDRPRAMVELRDLLERRDPLYRRAEIHVATSGKSVAALVGEIVARLSPTAR